MEKKIIDPTTIKGWGIDADPEDHPNYPIKKYTGDDHNRKNWTRPTLQTDKEEILMSTERPYLSAVYGTKHTPRGLSGSLRRFAFRYSENKIRHWLTLLAADRIDTVEGVVSDLAHGKIPRLAQERGWGAIAKHRPALLARKIAVRALVLGAIATAIAIPLYKRSKKISND